MAYSYTVFVFEVGDKVVPEPHTMDEEEEYKLGGSEVLTINSTGPHLLDEDVILTFEEIEGEWNSNNFHLHPDTPIRREY